jgi:uncharacterized protein (DUF342 family)
MPDESPEKTADASQASGDTDLLDGLESLLEEEGSEYNLTDEDFSEDDIADVFSGAEEDFPVDVSAPSAPAGATSVSGIRRHERGERRRRDREDFDNLETHLQATALGIEVAEDGMAARVTRITSDNSHDEIVGLLRRAGITEGIDDESIRAALAKASSGRNQSEVLVARGKPPRVIKPTEIVHHLPSGLITGQEETGTPFENLRKAIEGPFLESCKSWRGPVRIVGEGDTISEIIPAQVEPAIDGHGKPVGVDSLGGVELVAGDNVSISEDGMKAVADLYGYAGLIEGAPTVISPIWLSSDHMEARFVFHAPQAKPPPVPTVEDLKFLLEMKWIEFGIMDRQLELICARLREKQALPVTVPVAQGTQEIPGKDAQIKYAFDPFELIKWSHLQSILGQKAPQAVENSLREIYESDADGEAGNTGICFKAVRPGEIVVEKIPATPGVPGQDVQGEETTPDEGKEEDIEVGEGLLTTEDKLHCTADQFGYVAMRFDSEVTVISPLWIAPDRTAAYFLNLPQSQAPKFPSVEHMQDLLDEMKITNGYVPERWAEIVAELEAGKRTDEYLIPVGRGTAFVEGKDAIFEWAVQIVSNEPGKILDDGTIDFRDRNLTTVAKEGDLLGKLVPPSLGTPGMDIYGTDLQPPFPLNIEVITDSLIYAEPEEDGSMAFYCETGGGISSDTTLKVVKSRRQMRINIGVYPISNIPGDVDYSTGNIDFNGDVVIDGSVQSQFSVKATGTVTIGGYVEAGAYVTAGKDILIQRGVVGSSTELVAGGDIMSKFIQEATVRAGGDVKVGSYIFNASVRAGGQVFVPGMGEGKSRALVGGLVWGAKGITARSVGSPYNASTRLVVGVDPDQVNRADQIRANMRACQGKQNALLKKLGGDSLDLNRIKQKLARCASAKQKKSMLVAIKRIAKIAELERNQQEELQQIADEQRKLAARTTINVLNDLFAGAEIRIGEQTEMIREDCEHCSYKLVIEDEEQKIQQDVLKNTSRFN